MGQGAHKTRWKYLPTPERENPPAYSRQETELVSTGKGGQPEATEGPRAGAKNRRIYTRRKQVKETHRRASDLDFARVCLPLLATPKASLYRKKRPTAVHVSLNTSKLIVPTKNAKRGCTCEGPEKDGLTAAKEESQELPQTSDLEIGSHPALQGDKLSNHIYRHTSKFCNLAG